MRPRIIRFPPSAVLTDAKPRTFAERLRADMRQLHESLRQLFRPSESQAMKKARVFHIKNPAHWKLERTRRKARGML